MALAPTRASPRHKLGTALFYQKDRRGAFEQLQEAVRLSPSFAPAHYALGVMHEEAAEGSAGRRVLFRHSRMDPTSVDAQLRLADALRRGGQLAASLSEYERVLSIDPGAVKARFGYAATLIRLHQSSRGSRSVGQGDRPLSERALIRARGCRLFAAAPDKCILFMTAMALSRSSKRWWHVIRGPSTWPKRWRWRWPRSGNTAPRCSLSVKQSRRQSGRAGGNVFGWLADNLTRYQACQGCPILLKQDDPIEFSILAFFLRCRQ